MLYEWPLGVTLRLIDSRWPPVFSPRCHHTRMTLWRKDPLGFGTGIEQKGISTSLDLFSMAQFPVASFLVSLLLLHCCYLALMVL